MIILSKYFFECKRWQIFIEANPLLQVDFTKPCPSADLVEGEPYVLINFDPTIYKVIFRKTKWIDGSLNYTFEIESNGKPFYVKKHQLEDVLFYQYTEYVPFK